MPAPSFVARSTFPPTESVRVTRYYVSDSVHCETLFSLVEQLYGVGLQPIQLSHLLVKACAQVIQRQAFSWQLGYWIKTCTGYQPLVFQQLKGLSLQGILQQVLQLEAREKRDVHALKRPLKKPAVKAFYRQLYIRRLPLLYVSDLPLDAFPPGLISERMAVLHLEPTAFSTLPEGVRSLELPAGGRLTFSAHPSVFPVVEAVGFLHALKEVMASPLAILV